ncbi:MAG: hypothetical protein ACJAZ2_000689 [Glaciecola sp.]|jgi:hypothetical protein
MIKTGIYRHYKDKLYEVIDVATHSESQEQLVVYKPLYGESKLWVRPLAMFQEEVTVEGEIIQRFTFVEN